MEMRNHGAHSTDYGMSIIERMETLDSRDTEAFRLLARM